MAPPVPPPPPHRPPATWPMTLAATVIGVALLGALALLQHFDPSQHGFYPTCTFHRITGLNCPGCGGLRATHHLLHGRVATAWHHNALLVLSLPMFAWLGAAWLWRRVRGVPPPLRERYPWWPWVMVAVLVIFTVARNLPFPWFAGLSP